MTCSPSWSARAPARTRRTETYRNVTVVDGPQRLDLVLAASNLVRVHGDGPDVRPAAGLYAVAHVDVDGLHLVANDARRCGRPASRRP